MMAEPDFTGKVAIVTGASRGIGRTITVALAERGALVVGTARKLDSSEGTGGTLKETIELVERGGGKAFAVPADISGEEGPRRIVEETLEAFGRIDMLVNNAGMFPESSIAEMDLGVWRDNLDINLTTPFIMSKAVLPIMMRQRSGNILNITSGASVRYLAGYVAYGTAKAGLNALSWLLAREVQEYGIAVNSWMPGLINTDMSGHRGDDVSVVVPSTMWLLAQTAGTFTGQIVERKRFGTEYGPKV